MSVNIGVVISVAAIAVSIVVATISALQWRISRAKLRLDLYNRRYEIYTRVLDYYQEVLKSDVTAEQSTLRIPFVKAVRESRFIFPAKSGVFALLEELDHRAFFVSNFKETRNALAGCTEEQMKLGTEKLGHVNWILSSMASLEEMMLPYMRFDRL